MKKAIICAIGALALMLATNTPNDFKSWYFVPASTTGEAPGWDASFDLENYNTHYLGDTSRKEIYLTFDEGYENGHTEVILDVLRDKNVPAAFFVTKPYIKDNPDLVRRMVDEGHVVGNHTVRHKSSPSLSCEEIATELAGVAEFFKEITGKEIPKFFRPPMGEYSQRVLETVANEGYATIFWSFAYEDWKVDKQPGVTAAHRKVTNGLHNGAILLLHAVSSSNAGAMGDIIDTAREMGYEFRCLHQLTAPAWPPTLGLGEVLGD
ncbi:MAG: polysaccharide deacetylase family protein [Defluviitaleaceae bacterium]|nr:polysaccharide deacetylase family protein [Defluviitaleaceae bacterium]